MTEYKFYIPIKVRYIDLDAQWHANHTKFLSYMEQVRMEYAMKLNLFDGKNFLELGAIVADIHISYLAPIQLNQKVRAGIRVARIGNKSIIYEQVLEDFETGEILARGEVVSVCYSFREQKSIPVPEEWRKKISEFEGKEF